MKEQGTLTASLARDVMDAPHMKVWLRIDTGNGDVHFTESEVYVVTAGMFDKAQRALTGQIPEQRKKLRTTVNKGEATIHGLPNETILDLIYEARREGRLT